MRPARILIPLILAASAGSVAAQAPENERDTPAPLAAEPQASGSPQQAPSEQAQRSRTQNRAVSPALAAALAERMPKYNPPPPPREPTEEELEAMQPRNRIIRLPQMVVEGKRPPVFRDRDINTEKGMAELAVNRYLSELDRGVLNRYTLPLFGQSNEQRALAQYAEDERLRNMRATEEDARMIRASEGEDAAEEFRDTANATFIRTPYLPEPSSMSRD